MRSPNRSIRALIFAIVVVAFMLLGCLPFLHAQATNAIAISNQIVSPGGAPAQNASVLVCQITAVGAPCPTSGVYLYADPNLAAPITNPVSTDQYGNYAFFTTTGAYQIQVTPAGASGPTYVYYYINQLSGSGNGSVTAVGLTLPTDVFNVTGSPITTAGVLTGAFVAQAPNSFFAGPGVGPGDDTPTFRPLQLGDIPAGLPYVTSVGFSATPTLFTVSGEPITSTGTITLGVADQPANYVFAGPISGSAGTPAFRPLVTADFPTLYYQNVQINGTALPPTATLNFSASFASPSTSPTTQIALAPTAVTAGSYACASITVNAFGQLTAANSVGCPGSNVPQNTVFAGPASGGPGAASWQTAPTFSAANLTNIPAITEISVVPSNGVSATITNATTTPALTFTLGAITPSSINSTGAITGTTLTASLLNPYAGQCASIGANGTIVGAGGACGVAGSGQAFSLITSGVNVAATMTVAAGSVLEYSSGGVINASQLAGITTTGTPTDVGWAPVTTSATTAAWTLIPGLAATNTWTGANSFQAVSATTLTATSLAANAGNCLQLSTGGVITTSGAPCVTTLNFGNITSGTNTAATMTVASGSTITYTTGGNINASALGGVAAASYCQITGTHCLTPAVLALAGANGVSISDNASTWTVGLGNITPGTIAATGTITAGGTISATNAIAVNSSTTDSYIGLYNYGSGGRAWWWDSGASGSGIGAGNLCAWDATGGGAAMCLSPSHAASFANSVSAGSFSASGAITSGSMATGSLSATTITGATQVQGEWLVATNSNLPNTGVQGSYIFWNTNPGGQGGMNFVNLSGGGAGGFTWQNGTSTTNLGQLMVLSPAGNLNAISGQFNNGLTAFGYNVCLQNGAYCDSSPTYASVNATTIAAGSSLTLGGVGVCLTNGAGCKSQAPIGMSMSSNLANVSRGLGGTYTNTTGGPVFVTGYVVSPSDMSLYCYVNGVNVWQNTQPAGFSASTSFSFMVPPGATYELFAGVGSATLYTWYEFGFNI